MGEDACVAVEIHTAHHLRTHVVQYQAKCRVKPNAAHQATNKNLDRVMILNTLHSGSPRTHCSEVLSINSDIDLPLSLYFPQGHQGGGQTYQAPSIHGSRQRTCDSERFDSVSTTP